MSGWSRVTGGNKTCVFTHAPPRGAWVFRWTFSPPPLPPLLPPLPPPLPPPSNLQICQRPLTIETDNMGSLKCDIVCQNFWKRTATNARNTGASTGSLHSQLPRPHRYDWGIESHRSKYSSTGTQPSEAVTISSAFSILTTAPSFQDTALVRDVTRDGQTLRSRDTALGPAL